ncbi:MAG: NADH-quinone oxidoreductase subunit J [Elusimicrobia bacterium]|nr:NADH-quinone oxidoreductase subunit J [Elusimicrobiota bacterium]
MTLWAVLLAGAAAVLCAAVMLLHRSLYVSAVCLLGALLQTGVLFLLCGAPLLGLLQVMICAGAVMVLAVVTIMAAGGAPEERFARFGFPRWVAFLGLAGAAAEAALILRAAPARPEPALAAAAPAAFASVLFGSYAPAVEAAALLMFLAALAVLPDREGT